MLAPNAEVSLFPWKEPKERIPLAVRQIRSFLRAHRTASAWPVPPARQGGTPQLLPPCCRQSFLLDSRFVLREQLTINDKEEANE